MMIEDTSIELDGREYVTKGIQVIYPPISGIALRRVNNHERHEVLLELGDGRGGGSIYLIGGRYEKEGDAKASFERADAILKNGGIIKLLNHFSAEILSNGSPSGCAYNGLVEMPALMGGSDTFPPKG